MAVKSRGRGTVAALGLFMLLAGLVGGGVLYIVAQAPTRPIRSTGSPGRPSAARPRSSSPRPGRSTCSRRSARHRTTLRRRVLAGRRPRGEVRRRVHRGSDTEVSSSDDGGGQLRRRRLRRPFGARRSRSPNPVEYNVAVVGRRSSPWSPRSAAIPTTGVADLRRAALIARRSAGVVLGLLLLVLAGRRSQAGAASSRRRTARVGGRLRGRRLPAWPPEAPSVGQVPVNPHLPTRTGVGEPRRPRRLRDAPAVAPTAWEPPRVDAADETPPPPPPALAPPVLPDSQGRVRGPEVAQRRRITVTTRP